VEDDDELFWAFGVLDGPGTRAHEAAAPATRATSQVASEVCSPAISACCETGPIRAPNTATPITPPTWRAALSSPEATPDWVAGRCPAALR
jgi:hypothetical protein